MELNSENLYNEFQNYKQIINSFGALVQCYHETAYQGRPFNSELCIKANNLAGLKIGSNWKGPIYNKVSWEQRSTGERYEKVSSFRAYQSWKEFCSDYSIKIKNDYPFSSASSDNFIGYYCGLFKGKWGAWATDLNYLSRLLETTRKLAPEFFGEEWRDKILSVYRFAKDNKRILTNEQEIIIDKWIKELN